MIKRKIYINLLLVALAFSCTSCIGIIEKVFFKKDGSGTYSMTLDMSKMANMMAMFSEGDDSSEMDEALKGMNESFEEAKAKLETVTGISNLSQNMNQEKLIYTISFDFTDVNALNAGLNRYFEEENNPQTFTYFEAGKKSFSRTSTDRLSDVMNNQMGLGNDNEFDPSILLADAYYETIIGFERKIKAVSNDEYTQDGNTISLKRQLFDKRNAEIATQVTVKVK